MYNEKKTTLFIINAIYLNIVTYLHVLTIYLFALAHTLQYQFSTQISLNFLLVFSTYNNITL